MSVADDVPSIAALERVLVSFAQARQPLASLLTTLLRFGLSGLSDCLVQLRDGRQPLLERRLLLFKDLNPILQGIPFIADPEIRLLQFPQVLVQPPQFSLQLRPLVLQTTNLGRRERRRGFRLIEFLRKLLMRGFELFDHARALGKRVAKLFFLPLELQDPDAYPCTQDPDEERPPHPEETSSQTFLPPLDVPSQRPKPASWFGLIRHEGLHTEARGLIETLECDADRTPGILGRCWAAPVNQPVDRHRIVVAWQGERDGHPLPAGERAGGEQAQTPEAQVGDSTRGNQGALRNAVLSRQETTHANRGAPFTHDDPPSSIRLLLGGGTTGEDLLQRCTALGGHVEKLAPAQRMAVPRRIPPLPNQAARGINGLLRFWRIQADS